MGSLDKVWYFNLGVIWWKINEFGSGMECCKLFGEVSLILLFLGFGIWKVVIFEWFECCEVVYGDEYLGLFVIVVFGGVFCSLRLGWIWIFFVCF